MFFVETSFNIKFAKLGAAFKAYNALSPREFTLDPIIKGSDCLADSEYELVETDELHVLYATHPVSS